MPCVRPDFYPKSLLVTAIALAIAAPLARAQTVAAAWTHPSPLVGQTEGQRIYTLEQLLGLALSINPKNWGVEEQAKQARLTASLVKSQYAPQVDFKTLAGIQHTPLAIPQTVSPRGYFVSHAREVLPNLELKWLLFDFGRRKGQLQEAQQNALAAEAGLTSEQEKLVFDVSKAYFTASAAQGKVRAASKALQAAQLTEQAVAAQRLHGRATVVQLAEAHRQTAAAQLGLTKTSGDAATAMATLAAVVGLPPAQDFRLAPAQDSNVVLTQLEPLRALIDQAINARPDILAAQDKVAAAEAAVHTAHAAYRPTIGIQATVFQNIGETSSDGSPYSHINREGNSLFLAFDLPLADGGARATHVSIANSQRDEAEDELADTRNNAIRQVVQSWNDLKTSLDNRRQALDYTHAAEVAYEASLDAYRHGLSSINDLTNDEAALAEAEASQEDADAGVMIARAALALAIGAKPQL